MAITVNSVDTLDGMSEEEEQALLAEIQRVSERSRELHNEVLDVASLRGELVRRAMDAGIPRNDIAKAAGVARTNIYKLAGES